MIEVDEELQPHAVKRTLLVQDNFLIAYASAFGCFHLRIDINGARGDRVCSTFDTLTIRLSRLTVNAFLENVDLVVRTLGEYGDEAAVIPSA